MAYVYHTRKGRNLRKGDELRAADGKSWLDPIRDVVADAARHGVVDVWIKQPLRGRPDFHLYGYNDYRVRRYTGE